METGINDDIETVAFFIAASEADQKVIEAWDNIVGTLYSMTKEMKRWK